MSVLKKLVFGLVLIAGSCGVSGTEIAPQGDAFEITGEIDVSTRRELERALAADPSNREIRLTWVPGSVGDERALHEMGAFVRGQGLTTVVPSHGLVASGGTDMLVMGAQRVVEPGACIGVHSWYNSVFGRQTLSAAELPRDDPEHDLYLDFYDAMGISQSFYWFTISVAGPDEAHWMSPEEINGFGLSTVPVPPDGLSVSARAARCWARFEARV